MRSAIAIVGASRAFRVMCGTLDALDSRVAAGTDLSRIVAEFIETGLLVTFSFVRSLIRFLWLGMA